MLKFDKRVTSGTKVQLPGEYGYRDVLAVHETRKWITIDGLAGSFQRGHINSFTNNNNVESFPAVEDLYISDQYGCVYEKGSDCNIFIGKLNGKTLAQFADSIE